MSAMAGLESQAKRPNILLMLADDMSWKDWGVYRDEVCRLLSSQVMKIERALSSTLHRLQLLVRVR